MHHNTSETQGSLDGSASAWSGRGANPVLESILDAAEDLTPDAHVGICVSNRDGTYTTLAGSDPLVFLLDALQYELGEGPSLTAMCGGHTVIVENVDSGHRWPSFAARAATMGLRSHLGMPISVDGETVGALNLYFTAQISVDVGRLTHARLLVAQAAIALAHTKHENDLVTALQSSRTIGKALGLVMERFNLDESEAFAYLTRISQRANIPLRDLAAHLVKQANDLRHLTRERQTTPQGHAPHLTLTS